LRVYLDTSALAKRYVQEPGSEELEDLFSRDVTEAVVSTLALPEFGAALGRKVRDREINRKSASAALEEFDRDWQEGFAKVPLTTEIAECAAELVFKYPLKGGDAVHLATAMASRVELFVTSDRQLLGVCEKAGLKGFDPSAGGWGGRRICK